MSFKDFLDGSYIEICLIKQDNKCPECNKNLKDKVYPDREGGFLIRSLFCSENCRKKGKLNE